VLTILSNAKFQDEPVMEFLDDHQVSQITRDVLYYWKTIRYLKGNSIFGIAKNTVDVVKSIIKNEEISVPASVLLKGEYGLSDVCMGVPVRINKDGMIDIEEITLETTEYDLLCDSAKTIRKYIKSVETKKEIIYA